MIRLTFTVHGPNLEQIDDRIADTLRRLDPKHRPEWVLDLDVSPEVTTATGIVSVWSANVTATRS